MRSDDTSDGSIVRSGTFPLSFNQELIVLLCESSTHGSDGDVTSQNAVRYSVIEADVEIDALRAAARSVAARHDGLRTTFESVNGTWQQRVHPEVVVSVEHVDLVARFDDADRRRHEAETIASAEQVREFTLDELPLWTVKVLTLAPGRHEVLLTLCHLVADMRTTELVQHELDVEYRRALGESPADALQPVVEALPPAAQYHEHVTAQREALDVMLHGGTNVAEWRRAVEYGRLARFGLKQASRLVPMHLADGVERAGVMQALEVDVERDVLGGMRTLSRHLGVTLNLACLAAVHLALHRWSGLDRLVVWSEKSLRSPRFADVVGTFADATVFVTDVDDGETIEDLISDLDAQHQTFLGSDGLLVGGIRADPTTNEGVAAVLADSQRVLYQFFGQAVPNDGGAVLRPSDFGQPYDFRDASLDLHCCMVATPSTLRCRIRWDVGVFERPSVESLLGFLVAAMAEVAERGRTLAGLQAAPT